MTCQIRGNLIRRFCASHEISQNLRCFRARFCDLNHILDSALFRRICL
ncbi:hypothetical protein [Helicobacter sp. 23-1045]